VVECSSQGDTQSSSSSMAESFQDGDGDGDGIPDSRDKCTHKSNPSCYKEAA